MKKHLQHLVLAVCILLCVMPFASVAQSKKSRSNYLDNIYKSKSSQNQKSNRGRNNGASQFEQLLKDAKQQADKQKEQERKRNVKQKDKPAQGVINSKKEKDDISLVVSGEGPNKTEATKNALRSAIEQTYGTFVSASTEIMNDELVKDEIATVASGNIKSYKELSSIVLPNGNAAVTLSATVSIGKLIQYTQSHGGTAEFAGQTFMMNIRMRELNKRNEMKALNDMLVQLRGLENDLFDFSIEVKDPQMVNKNDSYSRYRSLIDSNYLLEDYYRIPIVVTIVSNSTYELFQEIISNTLKELSLSKDEIDEYLANNTSVQAFMPYKSVPTLFHKSLNDVEIYYLRNDVASLMAINTQICSILNNAQRSFYVQSSGGPRQEWIPSVQDIKTLYSQARHETHVPPSYNEEVKIYGDYVQTILGDNNGSSTTVPKGKGIVFNTIEHSFLYATESLAGVNGFEVIKQSAEERVQMRELLLQEFKEDPSKLDFDAVYYHKPTNRSYNTTIRINEKASVIILSDIGYSIGQISEYYNNEKRGEYQLIINCESFGKEHKVILCKKQDQKLIFTDEGLHLTVKRDGGFYIEYEYVYKLN